MTYDMGDERVSITHRETGVTRAVALRDLGRYSGWRMTSEDPAGPRDEGDERAS